MATQTGTCPRVVACNRNARRPEFIDRAGLPFDLKSFDIDETKVRLDELGGAYSMTASVTKRTIKRVKLINHERNPLRRQVVIDPTAHMTMELLLDHGP